MARKVIFYSTSEGKCPVDEFLDSLPSKTAQKVVWVLSIIEDFNVLPSSYFKKLKNTNNIWECRIQLGSNIYRIFCFYNNGDVILTHGFLKKTRKTPQKEITKAQQYQNDYFKRNKK